MVDPITDMLNRIRNAQAVSKPTVVVPFSNLKYEIAKILEKQGLVGKVEKAGRKTKKVFEINLRYEKSDETERAGKKVPKISGLKRISKPGQRIYKNSQEIKQVRGGYGIAIISTSKGLMTNKDTRKNNLGGEVICEIW